MQSRAGPNAQGSHVIPGSIQLLLFHPLFDFHTQRYKMIVLVLGALTMFWAGRQGKGKCPTQQNSTDISLTKAGHMFSLGSKESGKMSIFNWTHCTLNWSSVSKKEGGKRYWVNNLQFLPSKSRVPWEHEEWPQTWTGVERGWSEKVLEDDSWTRSWKMT